MEFDNQMSKRQKTRLKVIHKAAGQQREYAENLTESIADRSANLRQPHVRPIVRGKAGNPVEFGQKLAFSVANGFAFIEQQSFENFNEGIALIESAETYKARFGCYPIAILADTIDRNWENRQFGKTHSIRLSGPRLGRSKPDELDTDKVQAYLDCTAKTEARSLLCWL